jgi:UTP--glucose-1-phosphate uridylyltransferase
MLQSGKAHWCLYLPGLCIHAVPVVPGSDEELHLQHPQTPLSFNFYHLVPPSSKEAPAVQQTPSQHPALRRSLSPEEPPLDQHPAFRGSSTPQLPIDDDPTLRLSCRPRFPSKQHRFQRPPIPNFSSKMPAIHSEASTPGTTQPTLQEIAKLTSAEKAFENTSTSVAASQMRNALNNLADTVKDPEEKKLFETEMDNFFALFRRYLNDKAKGNTLYD